MDMSLSKLWAIVKDRKAWHFCSPWDHQESDMNKQQNITWRFKCLCCCYCCSVAQSCLTLCDSLDCSTPGFPVLHHLLEFSQTHIHWVGDAIQPSHPLLPTSPPALIFPQHQSFPMSCLFGIRWPKYWSFNFSISPSNEYSGFIFFRIDWFDLLAVQGTLKSLLQHHSSKASVLQCLTFLWSNSHICICETPGKIITLTTWALSLLLNMLSRFIIVFLPRNKHLLISWLQVPFKVIFGPKKKKILTLFPHLFVSPSICHEVTGPDAVILVFWMLRFKPAISLSPSSRSILVPLRFLPIGYCFLISEVMVFFLALLIPACVSYNLTFCVMYFAYKLNKQGDNIQPWRTPFPIWNQSIVLCLVLTVASWPTYRFLRKQEKWSGITISWKIFHSFFWSTQSKALFSIVNEAEADVFLVFPDYIYLKLM